MTVTTAKATCMTLKTNGSLTPSGSARLPRLPCEECAGSGKASEPVIPGRTECVTCGGSRFSYYVICPGCEQKTPDMLLCDHDDQLCPGCCGAEHVANCGRCRGGRTVPEWVQGPIGGYLSPSGRQDCPDCGGSGANPRRSPRQVKAHAAHPEVA